MKISKDFGKTNQPRMGGNYRIMTADGPVEAHVFSKGWGPGGRVNCLFVGVEYEDGFRETVRWPDAAEAFIDHPAFFQEDDK